MSTRVVPPHTTKIPISGGDWILVRTRLNHGENQDALRRMYIAGVDGQRRVDPLQMGMAAVTSYLVDWSLTGLDGQPLNIRGESPDVVESILNMLDEDSFAEIKDAIDAHELRMLSARAEEKKILSGATTSPTTSESPSVSAGASNGSAS